MQSAGRGRSGPDVPRVAAELLEPALRASSDPLAADLVARLAREPAAIRTTATRPVPRREALRAYREKSAKGDRPRVRTDGYPALLAALGQGSDHEVIVHGVAFSEVVYIVVTDAGRTRCLGVLRKVLLGPGA
jgi:hypothetical protein